MLTVEISKSKIDTRVFFTYGRIGMQNSNVIGHPYILQDLPLFSVLCRLEQPEDFVAVNSENDMIKVHLLAV